MEKIIERFLSINYGYGGDLDYRSCSSPYGSFGCGDGVGYGNEFGCGYGGPYGVHASNSGNGSCYDFSYCTDGIKSFNNSRIYYIDCLPTLIDEVHDNIAKGKILNYDLTLTPCFIVKQDNVFAHGETLHKAYEALQRKLFRKYPVKTRIAKFKEQYPDFDKKIPAKELFEWHHKLTGSCEMGRRSFVKDRGIDLEKDSFTVKEFVELTKDSYGGGIIEKICYPDKLFWRYY